MTVWQLDCIESVGSLAALIAIDSLTTLTALTAWMPWQLDCLDSSIALTARLLWQLDFLDSLNAFKLDCWNSLISLQYVPRMYMPVVKIILFTHNQFQLCCLKYWRIPSPLHCHCQPTSISYLCLCILQNVRILIIFISSVSTNSRLQLSCGLVCGVSAVSGLIQKWIEGNLQTHSPAHTQNTNSHDNSSIDPCHNPQHRWENNQSKYRFP